MLAVSAVHVQEIGAVIGILGALVIAYGALAVVLSSRSRRRSADSSHRTEKIAYLIGALLIALAFVVQILAINMRKTGPTSSAAAFHATATVER